MIRQWLVARKYAGRNRKAAGSLTGPKDWSWAARLGSKGGCCDDWLAFLSLAVEA
jgi:hypothetical protein